MRYIFCAIISSLSFVFSPLESKTLFSESNDIFHTLVYLDEDTLFVFDLDNTLIEHAQYLGSDQWFTHKIVHLIKQGVEPDDAVRIAISQLIIIHDYSEMRFVDPAIPDLLHEMQQKNVPMVGLTKRAPCLCERTLEQVEPLQLDLSKTTPIQEELTFHDLGGTTLKKGIIFVGDGLEKGPVFLAYLQKLERLPKTVVVIDDKMNHLQNIARSLEPTGIDFVGIRYGGADERVKAFNPEIADLQWKHMQMILSDEQALHLLQLENPSSAGE